MRLAVGVPGVGSTGSRIASAPLGGVGLYARRIIFIQTDRVGQAEYAKITHRRRYRAAARASYIQFD